MNAPVSAPAQPAAPPQPPAGRQSRNRFGLRPLVYWKALFGTPSQRRLAQAALQIPRVRHHEAEFANMSDEELLHIARQFRGRARGGESLNSLLPEVFGMVCVAAWRNLRLRPYDVQLAAGGVLHRGALAEVSTGEGKTLIATLPVALNALLGKGVHVTTTNDYLAKRDAEYTAPIYNALGLTVGVLQRDMDDAGRAQAYRCDITYATASEFGFDFLRDRLKLARSKGQALPFWAPWTTDPRVHDRPQDPTVQRGHHYALVDEADNIFIDEAKTPLIIANPQRDADEEERVVYLWADDLAARMTPQAHFYMDAKKQKLELTEEGRQLIRYANPPYGPRSHAMDKLHEHVERALHAHYRFRRDQHYLIEDGKVILIDESTGRRMPDRTWQNGLHQAVQAKERVAITADDEGTRAAAQITYQTYFKLYKKLAGMSGTAVQNFWEVFRVYKLWVVCVPTNRPVIRRHLPDRVFPDEITKFRAVAAEVERLRAQGRPILVGTRTVRASEVIGQLLAEAGIPHQVLNARPEVVEKESEIVAQAGRPGTVTIATNMAGRGTDIILGGNAETLAWAHFKDRYQARYEVPREEWKRVVEAIEQAQGLKELHEQVVRAGGLHVLGTERHEAMRVDRQLAGRAGRQGDPGSCQFFLSLEDELLEGLGQRRQQGLRRTGQRYAEGGSFPGRKYHPLFLEAQRRVERRHYRQRMDLLRYEKHRLEILEAIGADPYVD